MSRIVVYDLSHRSIGEFQAMCSRAWSIDGSLSTTGGGQTTVYVDADIASQPWLQFGRPVRVVHPKLPAWAGMIDTPWKATLPVGITLYNQAYMLSLRSPNSPEIFTGNIYSIAAQVIERINAQDEMFIRMGNISGSDIARQETFDTRSYWEQLRALAARAGKEIFLRPNENAEGRLITYVDVRDRIGANGNFLLHDGDNANIRVLDATVDGEIINHLTGIGSQDTNSSRLKTNPQVSQLSVNTFGRRSSSIQFQDVVDETTLLANTNNQLAFSSWPRIKIPLEILDVDETLSNVRPGDGYILHVGNLYLPGGKQGYRGLARLTALAYDETTETVGALAEVAYGI